MPDMVVLSEVGTNFFIKRPTEALFDVAAARMEIAQLSFRKASVVTANVKRPVLLLLIANLIVGVIFS